MALVPTLTDLIETGRMPRVPREWVTEIVAGMVIAALAFRIQRAQRDLLVLATTDPLTSLPNRRMFEQSLAIECTRARRTGQALCLVYLDLDHFKRINDQGGHATGDKVLKQLANAMRASLRAQVDQGFRIGGDEFALLLPGSGAEQAQQVVARLRAHCRQQDSLWRPGELDIAAGVVELDDTDTPAALMARADQAMYNHKRAHHAAA
jgi:diguanylate cyclase (GGDEF)-like protein